MLRCGVFGFQPNGPSRNRFNVVTPMIERERRFNATYEGNATG